MQTPEEKMLKEMDCIFKALQIEWERTGKTVSKRKIGQDELDMFTRYYNYQVREYSRVHDEIIKKPVKTVLQSTKEMSILGRIAKKMGKQVALQSTKEKGYFLLELDKEERKTLENIIGSED